MKTLKDLSFPVKGIGLTAVLLLLTQSAFALGTDEDTDVDNRATVAYSVGLVAQEVIESDDFLSGGNSTPGVGNGGDTTFEVDRLIDFELTENGDGNTIVAPDETNAITTFLITNSGNDHQDFTFTVSNQGGTFDMNPLTFEIWVDVDDDGAFNAVIDNRSYVDDLVPDGVTTARIFVLADADNPTPTDGQTAIVELVAVAHYGEDGALGNQGLVVDDHTLIADDAAVVQNVFGEGGAVNYDNAEEALDTYEVQAATLTVTKDSLVISDLFGSANPKAVPGSVVEYTVTVENNGAVAADNVSISDLIQIANVVFNTGQYPNGDAHITVNGVDVIAPATCVADGDGTDGCTYVIGTGALTLGIAAPGVSIPATEIAVFTYQVTIL